MRPTLRALAEQQIVMEAQGKALDAIAAATGIDITPFRADATRRVARLRRSADAANPANPIPDPAAAGAAITTQDAATPAATTTVDATGPVLMDQVAPAATDSVMGSGTVLDEGLSLNEVDVTAPVQGTTENSGANKVETEIVSEVGNPPDPSAAFPLQGEFASEQKVEGSRVFAALRLARLRMQAGVAPEQDDVLLGQAIASSRMSDAEIAAETRTLSQVAQAQAKQATRQPVSRSLVPRTATQSGPQAVQGGRAMPSLVSSASGVSVAPSSSITEDELGFFD